MIVEPPPPDPPTDLNNPEGKIVQSADTCNDALLAPLIQIAPRYTALAAVFGASTKDSILIFAIAFAKVVYVVFP